jgi:hypothetical protein
LYQRKPPAVQVSPENLVKYYDYDSAKLVVFQYIESWHNIIRIHGFIGYITPQQCEDNCKKFA